MRFKWHNVVGFAVGCLILWFIIRNLRTGLGELGRYDLVVSPLRIAGAFAVFGVLFPLYGRIWQYIMARFGYPIGFGRTMRVWFLSQAGRYLPGKIWFALGRIYLSQREGVPKAVTSVAMALELALVLGSAVMVFGLVALVRPSIATRGYLLGALLVPVVLAGCHPAVIRAMLRRVSKGPVDLSLRYRHILGLLGLYAVSWCIYGVGFFLVGASLAIDGDAVAVRAVPSARLIPEMIGINALSWAGGFLSVITPAGLGVREGISSFMLFRVVDKPYASLIPLAARIWVTVAEVSTIGFVFLRKGGR